jgi:hypothetical protein
MTMKEHTLTTVDENDFMNEDDINSLNNDDETNDDFKEIQENLLKEMYKPN